MPISSTPYQAFVPVPGDSNVIGSSAVPAATTRPSTRSSVSLVFAPDAIASVVANRSVAPGSMVSVTPGATVRSPLMV